MNSQLFVIVHDCKYYLGECEVIESRVVNASSFTRKLTMKDIRIDQIVLSYIRISIRIFNQIRIPLIRTKYLALIFYSL